MLVKIWDEFIQVASSVFGSILRGIEEVKDASFTVELKKSFALFFVIGMIDFFSRFLSVVFAVPDGESPSSLFLGLSSSLGLLKFCFIIVAYYYLSFLIELNQFNGGSLEGFLGKLVAGFWMFWHSIVTAVIAMMLYFPIAFLVGVVLPGSMLALLGLVAAVLLGIFFMVYFLSSSLYVGRVGTRREIGVLESYSMIWSRLDHYGHIGPLLLAGLFFLLTLSASAWLAGPRAIAFTVLFIVIPLGGMLIGYSDYIILGTLGVAEVKQSDPGTGLSSESLA